MPPAQHFFQVAPPAQQHQAPPHTAQQRRRGLVGLILGWFAWLGKACLDAWEELCVGLLRESLSITQRAINGASAWTLSVFNRDYKAQLRGRWSVLQEQYSWWGRTEVGDRRSTLNAVLARKYDQGGGTSPAASQAGLRHRKPAGSSQPQRPQPHLHPAADMAGLSEIEPLGAAGGAAGPPGGVQQQWWGTPANWLSDIADGTTGAAAAAQEAATAAVQQAASTMTHAVEEAAATAASWARSMRAVFVEPPAGWGVHEAIKQTGLLEDVSLYGQLFISRTFDKLRWLLGKLTFSPVAQTPTAGTAAAAAAQWRRATISNSSSTAASMAAVPPGGPRAGFFGRLRLPQHPAAAAAGATTAAGRAGGFGGAGRMKLRSFTSVDLPTTRRLSLEAEYFDEQQQGYAAEESRFSDTSSDAYDDAQDDASSEASCSSTSSWPPQQQQQHVPPAALQAAAGSATSAVPTSASAGAAAAGDAADLPGPSLTVRVPQSTLKGRSGHGKVSFDAGKHAAAGQAQQKLGGTAAAAAPGALSGGPTPFATAVVQQQHQADMSTGSAQAAGSRGSGSRGRRRVPAGLGAVLPGRGKRGLQRSHSGPAVSALRDVSSAGQVIRMAGYPLEVHEVVTQDGYLLRMERIPQPASKDAVFMMHGVLDTSLTWVAGGITTSQAFAAWDRGFDVWLGTSRCNPPHEAADPARRGSRYWVYSHNEVGLHDMGAQLDHIHAVKTRELTALGRTLSRTSSSRRASATDAAAVGRAGGRRPSGRPSSGSTTASSRRPAGAAPEHADVLEGLVESVDALVGIQATGVPGGAAVGTGKQQHPVPSDATPTGRAAGEPELLRQVSPAPAPVGGASAGSRPPAVDMARAQSAAEVDQAAAVEAAEAFIRHRAALAAAGISPTGAYNVPPAQQPDSSSEPRCQQQPGGPGPLSPLTPTAGAAAAAATRAASALGSAVATAAAAAGGIMGLAPAATPVSPSSGSKAEPCAERADMQAQQGSGAAGLDILPGRHNSSTTASSGRFATSGLLERLLGGTVPAADSQPWLGSGPLQPQGSAALRHVSSAPDVTSLGGCEDAAAAAAAACSSGAIGAVAGGGADAARVCVDCSTSGSGSLGGSGKDEVSSGGSRRVRRGSCPYFSLDSSTSVVVPDGQQTGGAGCGADMQEQQHLQWLQQQLPEAVSPFSEQQQPVQPQQAPHPAAAAVQQQPAQPQQDHSLQVEQQRQRHVSQEVCSPQATMAGQAGSGTPAVPRSSDWGLEPRPYNLRVVCHSLGGLLLLIYCTQRARAGRPHHISRLIMLSPAGFHPVIPGMFKPLVYVWRPLMLWTQLVWRQQGFPVQLPTFVARMLAFKLSIDTSKLPAVGDLLRSMARLLLGGDRSAWDRALLMPHYTAAGMPLLSSRQVLHFIQLYLTGRCQLFDYGSEAANVAVYQQRTPPVVSDSYHMLRDVPVHLVAGEHDGVIPAGNIRCHYAAMRAAGMDVSYREFDYGHMDFTFSAKEELGWYVMSLLMRT